MHINDIKTILKNRRLELGLTMAEVAKAVGVSEATVSRWESGNIANMKRSRIAALSKVLQIPPTIIMGYDSSVLDDIPLNILEHYQSLGMSEEDMIETYINFKESESIDIVSELNSISQEGLEIAQAYDKADIKTKNIVRISLDLPIKEDKYTVKESSNLHLLPNAANEIEGASEEDKAHDDALMDDDNF